MARVFKLIIDKQRCKGCKLCIKFCSQKVLFQTDEINHLGYNSVSVRDVNECTGCGTCFKICPDLVFELKKGEPA